MLLLANLLCVQSVSAPTSVKVKAMLRRLIMRLYKTAFNFELQWYQQYQRKYNINLLRQRQPLKQDLACVRDVF